MQRFTFKDSLATRPVEAVQCFANHLFRRNLLDNYRLKMLRELKKPFEQQAEYPPPLSKDFFFELDTIFHETSYQTREELGPFIDKLHEVEKDQSLMEEYFFLNCVNDRVKGDIHMAQLFILLLHTDHLQDKDRRLFSNVLSRIQQRLSFNLQEGEFTSWRAKLSKAWQTLKIPTRNMFEMETYMRARLYEKALSRGVSLEEAEHLDLWEEE